MVSELLTTFWLRVRTCDTLSIESQFSSIFRFSTVSLFREFSNEHTFSKGATHSMQTWIFNLWWTKKSRLWNKRLKKNIRQPWKCWRICKFLKIKQNFHVICNWFHLFNWSFYLYRLLLIQLTIFTFRFQKSLAMNFFYFSSSSSSSSSFSLFNSKRNGILKWSQIPVDGLINEKNKILMILRKIKKNKIFM